MEPLEPFAPKDYVKKKKRKAPKKNALKQIIDQLEVPESRKEDWLLIKNERYIIFSPYGEGSPVDTIGIDVGTKHLGITGLHKTEFREYPVVTYVALLSTVEKTVHENVDYIVDILFNDGNFEWLRRADHFRIEQQMMVNPSARAVSLVLRSLFSVFQYQTLTEVDVQFVNGNLKYDIAPIYSEESRNDPLRENKSGKENTRNRKLIGENDTKELLALNGEKNTLRFFKLLEPFVDQLHDITDSYLIGRSFYEDLGKKKRKL
jgi:hypothetical protein